MFVRKQRYRMPKTLDDAAEKVISDLPGGHQEILSRMTDKQFQRFYEKVAKFILDDFDLWLGNEELLHVTGIVQFRFRRGDGFHFD
ncbi:MAG: hypothetical protein P8Y40_06575 [Desulfobacterales bacterium]